MHVSAPVIRRNLWQSLRIAFGRETERDHVESVVCNHHDQNVRAMFIPPPEPSADLDSPEIQLPLGKRILRNAFEPTLDGGAIPIVR